MNDTNKQLAPITSILTGVSPQYVDLESIDIEALKKAIMTGSFFVEFCLFNQAARTNNLIEETNDVLSDMEKTLLDKEKIRQLSGKDQLELYKFHSYRNDSRLKYLLDLHNTMSDSLTHIKEIEKLQGETNKSKNVQESVDKGTVGELRQAILNKIKEKVKEKNNIKKG